MIQHLSPRRWCGPRRPTRNWSGLAELVLPSKDVEPQRELYGPDPYPPGVTANRAMLTAVAQQSYAEGLTRGLVDVDQLFWETVPDT